MVVVPHWVFVGLIEDVVAHHSAAIGVLQNGAQRLVALKVEALTIVAQRAGWTWPGRRLRRRVCHHRRHLVVEPHQRDQSDRKAQMSKLVFLAAWLILLVQITGEQ